MEEARYVKVASRFFLAVGEVNAAAGDGCGDDRRHFLDACFLCKRDITKDRHIFMYKGDAAFCSDDCRQEQSRQCRRRGGRCVHRTSNKKAAATGNWNIAADQGFF